MTPLKLGAAGRKLTAGREPDVPHLTERNERRVE
jgi:hypothetical protein